MAVPGKGARIAGHDYTSVNDGDIDDTLRDDFVPGLVVDNGVGKGQTPEQTRA